ncbi:MAG: hypothetical protein RMJ88_15725 [Thermogemmata sp.]|nr:hypothetical protein [Thermogemmata sp.]
MRVWFEAIFDTADLIGQHSCAVEGKPIYIVKEWSFCYVVKSSYIPTVHLASFVTDTIELWINIDTCICVYVDGYHPYGLWELASLCIPDYAPGILKAHPSEQILPGVGYDFEDMVPPSSWFDPTTGWWCIGRKDHPKGSTAVEFATDCVAVLVDERLVSLWMRPDNWRELATLFTQTR